MVSGDDTGEPEKASRPRKLKRKKKKSGNATLLLVVIVGVVVGLAALGGGGFAVWYFFFHKTADRAAEEALELVESFAATLEKAKDPASRSQATREINELNQRLERYIEKYRDCQWSEEERRQVQQKYEGRAKAAVERLFKAGLALALDPQIRQDTEFVNALQRFGETGRRMPRNLDLMPPPELNKPPPGPRPIFPSSPVR